MSDRPRTYKTEGIILRRRNFGEADSIFTVFGRGTGKFSAVAKGIRKPRSHMRGHIEPLTRSTLMVARGRSLDVFTQAETIDPYRSLHEDLERSAIAVYCCELADRFGSEHIEQDDVYGLLVGVLEALDGGAPPQVGRWFELHLLALNGYEVQLSVCAICAARLPEEPALFSAEAGGLVCVSCRARAGEGRIVSVRCMKVLRFAAVQPIATFAGVRIDRDTLAEVERVLGDTIRMILEREPGSVRYVHEVERLPRSPELSTLLSD